MYLPPSLPLLSGKDTCVPLPHHLNPPPPQTLTYASFIFPSLCHINASPYHYHELPLTSFSRAAVCDRHEAGQDEGSSDYYNSYQGEVIGSQKMTDWVTIAEDQGERARERLGGCKHRTHKVTQSALVFVYGDFFLSADNTEDGGTGRKY